MAERNKEPIRILVADDDPAVLSVYRSILGGEGSARSDGANAMKELSARLFGGDGTPQAVRAQFELACVGDAEAAVNAVRDALEKRRPFAVIFLDMRMPPGPDGAWAAARIRTLDTDVDIVIATAYADVDPWEISERIPPVDKLFYLQKPFHPHEVRQLALAIGRKAQAEARIRHQLAYFDPLTGLPNRNFFQTRLYQAIELARRHSRQLAVLFIDLDNFKCVNDTLGHSVGDQLLQITAKRLTRSVRGCDVVTRHPPGEQLHDLARLGGDEFTVLLAEIGKGEDAAGVAVRILENLAEPLHLAGHDMIVTSSLGIAVFPQDGEDVETLLKSADMAMYHAKRMGRNSFQYFSRSMNEGALKRLTLESRLRRAIDQNELSLHYQPQLDLLTGEVCGMEALLRWESTELGQVPPMEFIPIAEESGLIIPIGEWVLRTACRQVRAWRDAGLALSRMAVNVSALQFVQAGFPGLVARTLEAIGLESCRLELEVTETALIKDSENAIDTLRKLKALGVKLAVDDFGTGYSSLSRLKDFPLDRLKIDRSFIRALPSSPGDKAIATAVIAMANSMNLKVIAEGVENDGQIDFLRDRNCDEIQGYLVSRPLPVDQAEDFLRKTVVNRVAPPVP
ncbi:MAG TPA: EAL domain-containing protein [Xanthomonadaceae bacterium]|nr:EAL domain-containing protein [Xanthomonadaceae bacterium]